MPVHRCAALVLGSGAAGLRAAVELKRRDIDVMVATQSAFGGTSACLGSDKQTLHTANGAGRGDDFRAMADALGAGGAMHEDTAYIEAVGSPGALSSLRFLGLPIPQDRLGSVLRYQTDLDEVGGATSCGPRTSRLTVQALAREAIRLDVPIFNHTTGVRLLVDIGARPRSVGVLALRRSAAPPITRWDWPCSFAIDNRCSDFIFIGVRATPKRQQLELNATVVTDDEILQPIGERLFRFRQWLGQ